MVGRPASSLSREVSVVDRLGRFVSDRGLEGRAEVLYDRDVIEAFVVGGPSWTPATRGTYRSVLYRLADEVGDRGHRGTGFSGSPAPKPYTQVERAALAAMALGATSRWRRLSAVVMLAAGIGAGLRAGELVALTASDVTAVDGHVTVAVTGTTPRIVVVTARYAPMLADAAAEAGSGVLFRPGRATRLHKNFVNDFVSKLRSDPADPWWQMNRMRSTFICHHLAAGTPLGEVLALTGITDVESLARYAVYVPGVPTSKAALRAAAREMCR